MEESRSWREDLRDCTEAEREDAELVVDIVAERERIARLAPLWSGYVSSCVNATRCKYKVTCTAGSGRDVRRARLVGAWGDDPQLA